MRVDAKPLEEAHEDALAGNRHDDLVVWLITGLFFALLQPEVHSPAPLGGVRVLKDSDREKITQVLSLIVVVEISDLVLLGQKEGVKMFQSELADPPRFISASVVLGKGVGNHYVGKICY